MIGLKYAGIYRIVNLLDGRSYIGQSKDIEKRFKEHLYHKKSPIDRDIHEYGIDNFKLEILNICDSDDDILDHLEKIYINIYNSSDPEYGYNIHPGGQHDQVGYKNPNTKLTEFDIYNIREDYNNHIPKKTSYIKYKDKISIYGFDEIWQGKSWTHVHMDVYTHENKYYWIYETSIGENSNKSIFTDDEVLKLRYRYINETAKEIYDSVKNRCTFQTLQQILWGRHYSHLPIYDKKNKVWIK